jgi:hypothetical protein
MEIIIEQFDGHTNEVNVVYELKSSILNIFTIAKLELAADSRNYLNFSTDKQ